MHAHGGFEVKTIGDAFMIVFASARRALLCAIDLQRAFSAYSREHPEEQLRVRFGVHVGEPIREAGDFFGKSVIFASRVAAQATGGEILASALSKELAESAGDIHFGTPREFTLKGFDGAHSLYPVSWH
jgi:class 3 adenylate cyclase